jgi:hypothetical protein
MYTVQQDVNNISYGVISAGLYLGG